MWVENAEIQCEPILTSAQERNPPLWVVPNVAIWKGQRRDWRRVKKGNGAPHKFLFPNKRGRNEYAVENRNLVFGMDWLGSSTTEEEDEEGEEWQWQREWRPSQKICSENLQSSRSYNVSRECNAHLQLHIHNIEASSTVGQSPV